MGKFRDLMDEELRIRGYAPNTRHCYLRAVRDSCATSCAPQTSSPSKTSVTTNST